MRPNAERDDRDVVRLLDSVGRIAGFPPFLVFERKNFTLEEWIRCPGHATLDRVGVCNDVSRLYPLIRVRILNPVCLSQILSALDEMHRSGIVHGKLKPSNILWFESKEGGTWKVTGMNCPVQTGDFEQRFLRSGYAAPEVVRAVEAGSDATEVGPESDMWSLGVIAYECFTGDSITGESDSRHRVCVSLTGRKLSEELSEAHGSVNVVSKRALAAKIEQVEENMARDLLRQLLCLDASTRPNAQMTLMHDFFQPIPPAHSPFSDEVRQTLWSGVRNVRCSVRTGICCTRF